MVVFYCCSNNFQKFSGLKQRKHILLQFREPEVSSRFPWAEAGASAGRVSSGGFGGGLPPSFSASGGRLRSSAVGPSSRHPDASVSVDTSASSLTS